jgi:endonuclease YncB( thermonuclease family)
VSPRIALPLLRALALAAFLAAGPARALDPWTLDGRVVGVTDGDTLTVLDGANRQHVIRLGGIDAPERRQAFGNVAREALSKAAYDRRVRAECWKRDRYRREICTVWSGTRDVGLALVDDGLAWHYKAYEQEQTPEARAAYALAEREARAARRGLWQDPHALAPWDFRRAR